MFVGGFSFLQEQQLSMHSQEFHLDKTNHLRHSELGRNRDEQVHTVWHPAPLFYPAVRLLGEAPKHLPKVLARFAIQHLEMTIGDAYNITLALLFRMA